MKLMSVFAASGLLVAATTSPEVPLMELLRSRVEVVDLPTSALNDFTFPQRYSETNLCHPLRGGRIDCFRGTGDVSVLPVVRAMLMDHSSASLDLCMYLFEIMVNRPDWIFVHRTEIVRLRICTTGLIMRLESAPSDSGASRVILENFLRRSLDVIYSTGLERVMRQPELHSPMPPNQTVLFLGFMQNLLGVNFDGTSASSLMNRIGVSIASSRLEPDMLDSNERWFYDKLVASNFASPYVEHYGEFITAVFGHFARDERIGEALGLFKIIFEHIPNYDTIDWTTTTSELIFDYAPAGYAEGRRHFQIVPGMGQLRRSFMTFPAPFVSRLLMDNESDSTRKEALESCFPRSYFDRIHDIGIAYDLSQMYYSLDTTQDVFRFYSCLINVTLSERVLMPISEPEFSESVSSLLYMAMLSKSASAILGNLV